ncbi:MAG: hypothetical protein NVS3B19_10410 [Ginsengibacter sp.]
MEYFVRKDSIVRTIWSKGDTILFIFAGAAAEFALNKAVDWLYFTGKLPADPLGRLFSTVNYARQIVFSEQERALAAIDKITLIHRAVEANRGDTIPDWAYRDVLYMLIHYSIASYELLEKKLTGEEKQAIYDVFYRMGNRMGLKELPPNFIKWIDDRQQHMEKDLKRSELSKDLFRQYRKHLGFARYSILVEGQKLVIPPIVRTMLDLNSPSLASPLLTIYKASKIIKMDNWLRDIILPLKYKKEIKDLDEPYLSP